MTTNGFPWPAGLWEIKNHADGTALLQRSSTTGRLRSEAVACYSVTQ